jgi:tetratricopeptide (TPR) repeat protein
VPRTLGNAIPRSQGKIGEALRNPGGSRTPSVNGGSPRSGIGQTFANSVPGVRGGGSNLGGVASAARGSASNFLNRHAANLPGIGGSGSPRSSLSNPRSSVGNALSAPRSSNLSNSLRHVSSSAFLNRHAGQLSSAMQNRSGSTLNAAANFARSQLQSGRNLSASAQRSAQAIVAARNLSNSFGGYGLNGFGNYAYRGGVPYYSYRGYGGGYPIVSTALRLAGLGYGGFGYGQLGYAGLGYGGYGGYGGFYPGYGYGYGAGYWAYPWLRLAGGIVRGAAFLLRPFFGYGYGYGGYGYGYPGYYAGYGGYGYGYGNYGYGYSAYPTYTYTTNYTSYPVFETTTVVEDSSVATAPAPTDFAAQAEAEFKAGQYEAAAKSWRHALVDDPENSVLLLLLSQAQFATGTFDEAAGAAQHALQRLPKESRNVVVANFRELYGNAADYTTQLRALEDASEKTASPALQFLLGYHYGYLGYEKEAVRELDKGLKLMPQDAVAKELRDEFAAKLGIPAAANPPVLNP